MLRVQCVIISSGAICKSKRARDVICSYSFSVPFFFSHELKFPTPSLNSHIHYTIKAYAESFLTFMRDSKGRALLIRELPSNFQVMFLLVLIFVPLCVSSHPETLQESLDHFSLPDNFLFGMASSSYQVCHFHCSPWLPSNSRT